jgi:uncharacterized protein
LDRPVLVESSAVSCHWCEVVDRGTYDDKEIAKIINENFIPAQVNRDKCLEVERRYKQGVSAITRPGDLAPYGVYEP